jgi:NADH-quinone oxidoreductase subunit N
MAGIPLTAGFTGKWAVFEVALAAGAWPVVIVAVVASAAAAFFYVRVIVVMYFHEPDSDSAHVVHPSVLAATAIGIAAAATLALGVLPGPVLDLTRTAGEFIR